MLLGFFCVFYIRDERENCYVRIMVWSQWTVNSHYKQQWTNNAFFYIQTINDTIYVSFCYTLFICLVVYNILCVIKGTKTYTILRVLSLSLIYINLCSCELIACVGWDFFSWRSHPIHLIFFLCTLSVLNLIRFAYGGFNGNLSVFYSDVLFIFPYRFVLHSLIMCKHAFFVRHRIDCTCEWGGGGCIRECIRFTMLVLCVTIPFVTINFLGYWNGTEYKKLCHFFPSVEQEEKAVLYNWSERKKYSGF